jgi:hypothetical protein
MSRFDKSVLDRAATNKPVDRYEFHHVADYISKMWDLVEDQDEDLWEKFIRFLDNEFDKDTSDILDGRPSDDYLHYHSNGAPDQGKVRKFLSNWDEIETKIDAWFKRNLSITPVHESMIRSFDQILREASPHASFWQNKAAELGLDPDEADDPSWLDDGDPFDDGLAMHIDSIPNENYVEEEPEAWCCDEDQLDRFDTYSEWLKDWGDEATDREKTVAKEYYGEDTINPKKDIWADFYDKYPEAKHIKKPQHDDGSFFDDSEIEIDKPRYMAK